MVRQRFAKKNPDGQVVPLALVLHEDQELVFLELGRVSHLSIPRVRRPSYPPQAVSFGEDPRRELQDEVLDVTSMRVL